MDILREAPKVTKDMKSFNYTLGRKSTHLILYDFRHPFKKHRHEHTIYYHFRCRIISRDFEQVPFGIHSIQLPSKRVMIPLFEKINAAGKLDDKEIEVTIVKINHYNFDITLHIA